MRLHGWLFAGFCLGVLWSAAESQVVAQELADEWAFQPLTQPKPPIVQLRDAVRNPIDAFLLGRLEAKGLRFTAEADKITLLRRVTFGLTGRPPLLHEIDAFLRDTRPDAYERVVDRLLQSVEYGEHAASAWLDLVRFAESDGFKADDPRPHAWRYRDYVIRSFNSDKPYDRFIREQLAGDELYPGDVDALIATGFTRHYPDEYNAVNLEQRRQEILNDITDTTGTAFLGLTLGCAKCHDHKYDPVTQEDYYRFQAFFAGWYPLEKPLSDQAELAEYQRQWQAWLDKTAAIRKELEALEAPYRAKHMAKERQRFPEEYARLLDIPDEKRTPLERQIAIMIEKQVYPAPNRIVAQMKVADKERWNQMNKQMVELAGPRPPEMPKSMVMTDLGPTVPPTFLLRRGDWKRHGKEVRPGFLSAIDDRDAQIQPPKSGTSTGRRTALANWIASKDNPLTARVEVNRLWQRHFGRGIVGTPGDFGVQGDKPTHPELLDWLAQEFIAHGWSRKHIDRLIVTSTAYRQGNSANPAAWAIDPENRLLWRMNRRRIDGEMLRDAVLTVNGSLSQHRGGPSVFPELPSEMKVSANAWPVSASPQDRNKRSIYVFVKRNLRYPLFALFDAPDRTEVCARRFVTTTAPQALTLLNDRLLLQQAEVFADRVLKEVGPLPEAVIEHAFRLALARTPNSTERQMLRQFLTRQQTLASGESAFRTAVIDLCHVLLNTNEFLYVD